MKDLQLPKIKTWTKSSQNRERTGEELLRSKLPKNEFAVPHEEEDAD
jgi:hypothetical protein